MPSYNLTITAITHDAETGALEVQYDFGGLPFTRPWSDVATMISQSVDPIEGVSDRALAITLAWWLARDPTAADESLIVNKAVTIDYGAPVQVVVV